MDTVHVYDADDGPRWRRRAPNGRGVAASGESFSSEQAAIAAAEREGAGACRIVRDREGAEPEVIFDPDVDGEPGNKSAPAPAPEPKADA